MYCSYTGKLFSVALCVSFIEPSDAGIIIAGVVVALLIFAMLVVLIVVVTFITCKRKKSKRYILLASEPMITVIFCLSLLISSTLFLAFSLSTCLSVSVCLSVCLFLSVCLSVCLSACLSVYLFLSVCLSLSLCLSVCLSVSLFHAPYFKPIYLVIVVMEERLHFCQPGWTVRWPTMWLFLPLGLPLSHSRRMHWLTLPQPTKLVPSNPLSTPRRPTYEIYLAMSQTWCLTQDSSSLRSMR